MPIRARLVLISVISLLTVGIDQATKALAAEFLPRGQVHSYWFDTVRIVYAENSGAFLGLGGGLSPELRFALFVVLVGFFLLGLLAYTLAGRDLTRLSVAGLALLFAGGLSNFYDRLANNGAVIDFINMGLGPVRTGIFNIADMAIMLGLLLLILAWPRESSAAKSSAV
jgi:signal peptidase II